MTFVQLAYKGKPFGWYQKVSSQEELFARHQKIDSARLAEGWWEYVNSAEADTLRDKPLGGNHLRSGEAQLFHAAASTALCSAKSVSPFDLATKLEARTLNSKLKALETYGAIYFNKVGGWMFLSKDFTIIARHDGEGWPDFTEADISLKQWKEDGHWYAKIGGIDVPRDDHQVGKWDTRAEASDAAHEFLAKLELDHAEA